MHAAGGSKSLERNVNLVNHAAALFYLVFVNRGERDCRKASLMQKCHHHGFTGVLEVMEMLLHHLLFSLSPVLHHEP